MFIVYVQSNKANEVIPDGFGYERSDAELNCFEIKNSFLRRRIQYNDGYRESNTKRVLFETRTRDRVHDLAPEQAIGNRQLATHRLAPDKVGTFFERMISSYHKGYFFPKAEEHLVNKRSYFSIIEVGSS